MVVSIRINTVGYPIAWMLLPESTKRGTSNTSQRIRILKKVLKMLEPSSNQMPDYGQGIYRAAVVTMARSQTNRLHRSDQR